MCMCLCVFVVGLYVFVVFSSGVWLLFDCCLIVVCLFVLLLFLYEVIILGKSANILKF